MGTRRGWAPSGGSAQLVAANLDIAAGDWQNKLLVVIEEEAITRSV